MNLKTRTWLVVTPLVASALFSSNSRSEATIAQFVNVAPTALNPSYELQGFSFQPGVAFIDYDNDGDDDIYASNGDGFPNAFYINEGENGFVENAAAVGLDDLGQGTGIAVGDLNNDGFDDIYLGNGTAIGNGVTDDGFDHIFISNGDGTFRDETGTSGIFENGFTTSVGFADYDRDGDLDIMVGRFIDFDQMNPVANRTNPTKTSHLYRNNGDLTFTDVTEQAGVVDPHNTWAIAWFDYDGDQIVDLIIAHEQGPISVFKNKGDGTFENHTEIAGDTNEYGAWMGIAVGDYDNDGDFDMFASNISDVWGITRDPELPSLFIPPPETHDNPAQTLFRNNGDGTFTNVNDEAGISQNLQFAWGTVFADFNNDGWVDIYLAQNFAPVGIIGREREGAGPGRVLMNSGDGTFDDQSYIAGSVNFSKTGGYLDGRGVAYSDFNNDGFVDLYLQNVPLYEEPFPFGSTIIPGTSAPKLLQNVGNDNHWIKFKLVGENGSPRTAVGAEVTILTRSGKQVRTQLGGGSVLSASSQTIHFGLGDKRAVSVFVRWPDGTTDDYGRVRGDKTWLLVQGKSRPRVLKSDMSRRNDE